jgi:uncharacterized alpha/beta hydrolase family protein
MTLGQELVKKKIVGQANCKNEADPTGRGEEKEHVLSILFLVGFKGRVASMGSMVAGCSSWIW